MTLPDNRLESLLTRIREQFRLEWTGIHGFPHWLRVHENGIRLAEATGANVQVVDLFAFLHDSRRVNDGNDPSHGPRAAELARALVGDAFELGEAELELLCTACHGHSDGLMKGDITVVTCWDADRLDLGRVGVRPLPERLCTTAARDPGILNWAYLRSLK